MLHTVLFDLDGTLLPMDQEVFIRDYLKRIAQTFAPHGYDPGQLIETIWKGTAAMVQNDGSRTNEAVFWACFSSVYGERAQTDKPLFDAFYADEFEKSRTCCGFNPQAAEAVRQIRALGCRVALATNPIFPAAATEARIRWAGLAPADFELRTTYENAAFCKPDLRYYRQILQTLGAEPSGCLMVGNDVDEDMVAQSLGMEVFLLTDCLINRTQADIAAYPHGGFAELLSFVRQNLQP